MLFPPERLGSHGDGGAAPLGAGGGIELPV
jgi:hypothetical protein